MELLGTFLRIPLLPEPWQLALDLLKTNPIGTFVGSGAGGILDFAGRKCFTSNAAIAWSVYRRGAGRRSPLWPRSVAMECEPRALLMVH
jgi:hypothetical protein